jgi:hypothetical protein
VTDVPPRRTPPALYAPGELAALIEGWLLPDTTPREVLTEMPHPNATPVYASDNINPADEFVIPSIRREHNLELRFSTAQPGDALHVVVAGPLSSPVSRTIQQTVDLVPHNWGIALTDWLGERVEYLSGCLSDTTVALLRNEHDPSQLARLGKTAGELALRIDTLRRAREFYADHLAAVAD